MVYVPSLRVPRLITIPSNGLAINRSMDTGRSFKSTLEHKLWALLTNAKTLLCSLNTQFHIDRLNKHSTHWSIERFQAINVHIVLKYLELINRTAPPAAAAAWPFLYLMIDSFVRKIYVFIYSHNTHKQLFHSTSFVDQNGNYISSIQ